MKFYKGDKVFLLENREVGFVTRVEDENLLYVEVDGMEIPVFTSDISPDIPVEFQPHIKNTTSVNITPRHTSHLTELGLFICFEPQYIAEELKEFNIHLVNSFHFELAFDFRFMRGNEEIFALKKEIQRQDSILLFTITYDQLNDNPSFNLAVKRVDAVKKEMTFTQRIKPNNLFNKERELPFFTKPVYAYHLLEAWPEPVKPTKDYKAENLKAIEEKMRDRLKTEEPIKKSISWEPLYSEIDLHIEKLITGHKQLSNAEIMQIQLSKFREMLEKAIVGGLEKLYVIHGIGKGKLREEIFRTLQEYPEVRSYKNEYHPRYGFGATEIVLK